MTFVYIFLAFITGFLCSLVMSKNKNTNLQIENAKLNEKLTLLEEKIQNNNSLSELVKKEFVNIANQTILEKSKIMEEQNEKTLNAQIAPLKERIKEFQNKIEEFNLTGIKNTQSLKEQIEYLSSQNKSITAQTEKLANAINLNSKFRGTFGELILEKLLKMSGLINKKDDPIKGNYITQTGFKNLNNPEGNKIEPDAIIYLADGSKNIVVDSKASLQYFIEYSDTEDETQKQELLSMFMQTTQDRVKELEGKYNNLEGLNTPDFTLMFIPFESCMGFIYANTKLIEDANKRSIVIVGPSTLLATLRTINNAWSTKNQSDNIKEILKLGESIYSKCQILISKMEGLYGNFDTLRKGFDSVFKSLTGKGGLFGQIDKFKELGFNPVSGIDEKYLTDEIGLIETK